jgi:hypothetical protein
MSGVLVHTDRMPICWVRVPDALSQDLDAETLVLAPGAAEALHLNDTASLVWALLATPRSLEALRQAIASTYDVDLVRAAQDVEELLLQLESAGVVRRVQE